MSIKNTQLGYFINLDAILHKKGISKYKLSKDTGLTRKTLREINIRDCRISTLVIIANYLEIEISYLIKLKHNLKKKETLIKEDKLNCEMCSGIISREDFEISDICPDCLERN